MENDQVPQDILFTRIEKSNNISWSEIKTNPKYKCNNCDISFVDEELLQRHVRIMHNEQTKMEKPSVGGSKPSEIKSEMVMSHLVQSDDGQIIEKMQSIGYTGKLKYLKKSRPKNS